MTRRVWREAVHEPDGDGYRIMLDRQPLRVAGGEPLRVMSEMLARAVAQEWSEAGGAPGGVFGPDSLALTRLAATRQQRVAPDRRPVIETLLGYAGSDLLSYRAGDPQALVECQAAAWQPWLDWCANRHAARLPVVGGVMPVAPMADAVGALARALEAQDDAGLTALGVLVPTLGSLVLGLAVADGALDATEAVRLALLDEQYQLEQWGPDDETLERHAAVLRDTREAARFLLLSRQEGQEGTRMTDIAAITERWLIAGRVQGVGYRAWLAQEARILELSGWVRNLGDGRVEALLRGPADALARLRDASRQGPPAARVDAVEAEPWDDDDAGPTESGRFSHGPTVPGPLSRRAVSGQPPVAEPE